MLFDVNVDLEYMFVLIFIVSFGYFEVMRACYMVRVHLPIGW